MRGDTALNRSHPLARGLGGFWVNTGDGKVFRDLCGRRDCKVGRALYVVGTAMPNWGGSTSPVKRFRGMRCGFDSASSTSRYLENADHAFTGTAYDDNIRASLFVYARSTTGSDSLCWAVTNDTNTAMLGVGHLSGGYVQYARQAGGLYARDTSSISVGSESWVAIGATFAGMTTSNSAKVYTNGRYGGDSVPGVGTSSDPFKRCGNSAVGSAGNPHAEIAFALFWPYRVLSDRDMGSLYAEAMAGFPGLYPLGRARRKAAGGGGGGGGNAAFFPALLW